MKKGVFLLIALLVSLGLVYAAFSIGSPEEGIQASYSQNDFVKGWINISLDNENSTSLFEDNFGNSISLVNLLNSNSNSQYTCLPTDCENDYSYSNAQTSKTILMGKNQERFLGLVFTGNNFESISSFSLAVSSNAPEDTSKQLFIDILNDDSAEWQPYKASNNFEGEDFGCFENSTDESLIFDQLYCGKINLPVSPKIEIGAYVINNSASNATLVLSLEGVNSGNSASCEVTASATGKVSCIPNLKVDNREDYFVCIKTKSSPDNNKFKIESETKDACGYASTPDNARDFKIFAKAGRFAPVGTFFLNNSESLNSGGNPNLESYITSYIIDRYGSDCSSGCVVPLRIISQAANQQITLSNVSVFYVAGGTPKEEKKTYDLAEIPAKISFGFQKIFLDNANFSVSGDPKGNKTYTLNLSNNEVFSKAIFFNQGIEIISLIPKTVVAGFPTTFIATVNNTNNLSQVTYEWNFGNNDTMTTNESEAIYTYKNIGVFQLTLKATNNNGIGTSKTFTISVNTPREAVSLLLTEKLNDLTNVNSKLSALPEFQRSLLKNILNISKVESDLASLQQRNATAQTDNDYVAIMSDLVSVNVPKNVFESGKADAVPFFTNTNSINLDVLKEISPGGGTYEQDEVKLYNDAIVFWSVENVNSRISFDEFSAQYEDEVSTVLSTFKVAVEENKNRGNFYFVIKKIKDLEFKENYGQREASGYEYIKLDSQGQAIEFSTTEAIGFTELPIFLAPEFRALTVVSAKDIGSVKDKSRTILILVVLFVAIFGFVSYIVLQEWYRRKYEDYLFKNKNNLLNIVSYIHSSKKKGIKNEDIEKGLKRAGWSSEQVTYVMRKYAGKRTGMFEIPIGKIVRLFTKGKDEAFKENYVNKQGN